MSKNKEESVIIESEIQEDVSFKDPALRPKKFSDFSGQPECTKHLEIYVKAALSRNEAMDHVLLFGPPGLGKTTLAEIIAHEMNFNFVSMSAPTITKPADLVSILLSMEDNTVIFIDEIHRLNKVAAEMLYTAMEDRSIDIQIGEGRSVRAQRIKLCSFTLVGATTRPGMLQGPFRHRFGIQLRLEYYNDKDLAKILDRASGFMNLKIKDDALLEIAKRSRGTPRIAKRLLRRLRDFAHAKDLDEIGFDLALEGLDALGVDKYGLDMQDRRYINVLLNQFNGGPVGIETLAAALSEDREMLESSVEPYLMSIGILQRTPKGRVLNLNEDDENMNSKPFGVKASHDSSNLDYEQLKFNIL